MSEQNSHSTSLDGGRLYWFMMVLFVVIILISAIATTKQTQTRHDLYQQLMELRKQTRVLKVEEQRLIIEQQTFSATPHIAKRAITELKMFYPDDTSRLVLTPPIPDAPNKQADAP